MSGQHGVVRVNSYSNSMIEVHGPAGYETCANLVPGFLNVFSKIFVVEPNQVSALYLHVTLERKGIRCGLVSNGDETCCGGRDDPMENHVVILTYRNLRTQIVQGRFPNLLILDDLYSKCDDKDVCIHMLKMGREWKDQGMKILGTSNGHQEDQSRISFSSIANETQGGPSNTKP